MQLSKEGSERLKLLYRELSLKVYPDLNNDLDPEYMIQLTSYYEKYDLDAMIFLHSAIVGSKKSVYTAFAELIQLRNHCCLDDPISIKGQLNKMKACLHDMGLLVKDLSSLALEEFRAKLEMELITLKSELKSLEAVQLHVQDLNGALVANTNNNITISPQILAFYTHKSFFEGLWSRLFSHRDSTDYYEHYRKFTLRNGEYILDFERKGVLAYSDYEGYSCSGFSVYFRFDNKLLGKRQMVCAFDWVEQTLRVSQETFDEWSCRAVIRGKKMIPCIREWYSGEEYKDKTLVSDNHKDISFDVVKERINSVLGELFDL